MIQYEPVKAVTSYFSEVRSELAKVIWPKRQEVMKLTFIVVIISAVVGAYIGALDFIFVKLLETLLSR